jgi:UDP:flavonoid glycosyltransferase YjiC (YdhE family)
VSHCGWGGVIEAIDAGKPILAVPEFADQPMNAIKLVEKKVALALYLPKKRVMIPSTTLVSGKRFKPS